MTACVWHTVRTGKAILSCSFTASASSSLVNWVSPGWFRTLTEAGYRVIAIDNRGHGLSAKPHDADEYTPTKMAADAAALLDHLGIEKAHVMGYSMGARITAFLAIEHAERVHSAIFGGLASVW
jgi:non-heme chloroperoxidase